MDCSSLNLHDVCKKCGFEWNKVCHIPHTSKSKLARRWNAAVDAEFDALMRNELSRKEYNFAKRVHKLQSVNNDRFRVYGELRNGRPRIVVVTEFIEAVDNDKFWATLMAYVKTTKAHVWIMSEEENEESSYRVDGEGKEIPGSRKYGENYGKVERQVEISWRIEKMTLPQLRGFIRRLVKATDTLWKEGGCSII